MASRGRFRSSEATTWRTRRISKYGEVERQATADQETATVAKYVHTYDYFLRPVQRRKGGLLVPKGRKDLHHFDPRSRGGKGTRQKFMDNLIRLLIGVHRAWHAIWWNLRFLEAVFMLAVIEDRRGRLRTNYLLQRTSGTWEEGEHGVLTYVPTKDSISKAWRIFTDYVKDKDGELADPVIYAQACTEIFEKTQIRNQIRSQLGLVPDTDEWDGADIGDGLKRVFAQMSANWRRLTEGKFRSGKRGKADRAWWTAWETLWGTSTLAEVFLIRLPLVTLPDGSLDVESLTRYRGNQRAPTKKQHGLKAWERIAGERDGGYATPDEFLEAAARVLDEGEVRRSIKDFLDGRKMGEVQNRIRVYVMYFVGVSEKVERIKP